MFNPKRWFHDWEERILIEDWVPVRYQPILFACLFTGIVFVLLRFQLPRMLDKQAGPVITWTWLILAAASPPLLLLSWLMIRYCNGKKAYLGFYWRAAADFGQTFSYFAYMTVLVTDPTPEPEDAYTWIILSSILIFLIVLDVRDSLKITLLERTS